VALLENARLPPEEIEFQDKVLERSGLGHQQTFGTPAILSGDTTSTGIDACRQEYADLCFSAVEEVLDKTGVKPHQIKFVITNSSLFNPTPSLSASIINRFKMPATTINYSLGGMGCSAGVVAVDLAKQMLQLHPNSYALVVSHENITNSWYDGHNRTMQVPNCLFRANGSAVLLSSHGKDAHRAKYRLRNLVRTILAADDEAFNCIKQLQDEDLKLGVSLQKELIQVAGRALKANLTTLGPKVLPITEQLKFARSVVGRRLAHQSKLAARLLPPAWTAPYTPNFSKAFSHTCIHTGGRGVLDGMEKQLGLTPAQMLPSRAALFRFGNTSSTSIWYVLAYIETFQGLRAGQKVWQLGFGSGFKCNSAVWVANRRVRECHRAWDGFEMAEMEEQMAALQRAKEAYLSAKQAAAAQSADSRGSSNDLVSKKDQ
jgi:3-ketoacyl-CoA synthase